MLTYKRHKRNKCPGDGRSSLIRDIITMKDKTNSELAEKLREKILERMPPGGTRKDVKKIVEDIILGDDDDLDEGQDGE